MVMILQLVAPDISQHAFTLSSIYDPIVQANSTLRLKRFGCPSICLRKSPSVSFSYVHGDFNAWMRFVKGYGRSGRIWGREYPR